MRVEIGGFSFPRAFSLTPRVGINADDSIPPPLVFPIFSALPPDAEFPMFSGLPGEAKSPAPAALLLTAP